MENTPYDNNEEFHHENFAEPLKDLKVSADEPNIEPAERIRKVKKLAGAISHSLRQSGEINVRAFGDAAIGKSVKALAISRNYINQTHNDLKLSFAPGYITDTIEDGSTMKGIRFVTFTTDTDEELVVEGNDHNTLLVKADPPESTSEEKRINARKLAGAITHTLEENLSCVVRCFGNPAIGKASKALAISRGFTASRGPDMYSWSEFIVADFNGAERTGIAFYCYTNG